MDVVKIGIAIKDAREKKGISQAELAEKVGVSAQAANKWERGSNLPDIENLFMISKVLKVPYSSLINAGVEKDRSLQMDVRDRLFQEDHMFTLMRGFAISEELPETWFALEYMREQHEGQFRRPGKYYLEEIPYINHPLMMACQAHAFGIRDDHLLAAILLHDVLEDTDVNLEELPLQLSEEVKSLVELVTKTDPKDKSKKKDNDEYYSEISKNGKACVIKVIDRCNNLSTMAASFDDNKLREYVLETEKYILPLLEKLKKYHPEYYDLAFLVKYHIISLLETIKNLIVK